MRSTYKILNPEGTYFITSTIVNWVNVFTSEKYFNILVETINFYIAKNKLTVYAYVIMKNHFHMICKSENLTEVMRLIKSYTAKKIVEQLKNENEFELLNQFITYKKDYKIESDYQIWQEGFHPKEIINSEVLKQKIEYIHYNPVNEKYCLNPEEWDYSSHKFYNADLHSSIIKLEKII